MKHVLFFSLALLAASASARADGSPPVVHVDASSSVVLERAGVPVCNAPCDRAVDPRATYTIAGEGVRTSNEFRIPAESRVFDVDVKPASSGSFTTGIALTAIAGVVLAGGIALLAGSYAFSSTWENLSTSFWTLVGAAACGSASLAVGIPGVLLLANNLQSRARVLEGDRLASAPRTAPAPGVGVSLFSGSF